MIGEALKIILATGLSGALFNTASDAAAAAAETPAAAPGVPWETIAVTVVTSGFLLGVFQLIAGRKERAANTDKTTVETAQDLINLLKADAEASRKLVKEEREVRRAELSEAREREAKLRERLAQLEQKLIDTEVARREIASLQIKLANAEDLNEELRAELSKLRKQLKAERRSTER